MLFTLKKPLSHCKTTLNLGSLKKKQKNSCCSTVPSSPLPGRSLADQLRLQSLGSVGFRGEAAGGERLQLAVGVGGWVVGAIRKLGNLGSLGFLFLLLFFFGFFIGFTWFCFSGDFLSLGPY